MMPAALSASAIAAAAAIGRVRIFGYEQQAAGDRQAKKPFGHCAPRVAKR
jgi:hypothetical protein